MEFLVCMLTLAIFSNSASYSRRARLLAGSLTQILKGSSKQRKRLWKFRVSYTLAKFGSVGQMQASVQTLSWLEFETCKSAFKMRVNFDC